MNSRKRPLLKNEDENRPPKKDVPSLVKSESTLPIRPILGYFNINKSEKPTVPQQKPSTTFLFGSTGLKPISKEFQLLMATEEVMELETPEKSLVIDTYENYSFNFEYSEGIFDHLKTSEKRYLPDPNYMTTTQKEINSTMRSILIDWTCEVCQEYKLLKDTLYLSTNIIDRFLSLHSIARNKLQLVGVSAIFISAKYFEIVTPNIDDYVYITDHTYTKDNITSMEMMMLSTLQWNITVVTIPDFLDRFFLASNANPTVKHLSSYLCELTLSCYDMIHYSPSMVSTSAIIVALNTLGFQHWNESLRHYSGYESFELAGCVSSIYKLFKNVSIESKPNSTKEKYGKLDYNRVSILKPSLCEPTFVN